jgi:hypothetical protein
MGELLGNLLLIVGQEGEQLAMHCLHVRPTLTWGRWFVSIVAILAKQLVDF